MGFRGIAVVVVSWLLLAGSGHAYTLKHTASGGAVRWDSELRQVKLRVSPEVKTFLPGGKALGAIKIAADAWRGFGNVPVIKISDDPAPDYDPDKRGGAIYVLNPWPFEENRLAVTVTSYYPSGQLVGVDVLINGEVDYGILPEREIDDMPAAFRRKHDLGAVLTHEFGHVLGLDESLDDPEATMWPYIRAGETHQRTLAEDDEDAVIELYTHETSSDADAATTSAEQPLQSQSPPAACTVSVMGASSRKQTVFGQLMLLTAFVLTAKRRIKRSNGR